MEKEIKINFWLNDSEYNEISNDKQIELEEKAMSHIFEMINNNYTSGELNISDDEDNEFFGGWSLEMVTK